MRTVALALLIAVHAPLAWAVVDSGQTAGRQGADGLGDANAALQAGDLPRAKAGFEAWRLAKPGDAASYLGLSDVYVKQGNFAAAEAILNTGLLSSRSPGVLHRALGLLFALQNKPEMAISSFNAAIASGDNVTQARIEAANLLSFKLNQPARALPYYNAALAQDPNNALAHYGKGIALARLQKPGDPSGPALTELEAAQRLDPADPMASLAIAQELARKGDVAAAISALDEALRRKPALVPAQIVRGDLLQIQGRLPDAIASYEAAISESPSASAAWVGLGMAQQASGEAGPAEASYRHALAQDQGSLVALNNLASMLTDRPDARDEALTYAQKAAVLAPGQGVVWDTLGWVKYRRGDLDGAAVDLQHAAALAPTATTLTRLGVVKAAQGQKDQAGAAFRRALELKPDHAPALEGLKALG